MIELRNSRTARSRSRQVGMKQIRHRPTAAAAVAVMGQMLLAGSALAGPGYVPTTDSLGAKIRLQTFYANSPSGPRVNVPPEATALYPAGYPGTGKALRKFVDPMAQVGLPANGVAPTLADGVTAKYIPVAVPEKWVNPDNVTTADDYYEIAAVEYTERFHTDLRKPTTLRGYVQLSTARNPGKAIPLTYPDGSPILIQDTNPDGTLKVDAAGNPVRKQALAFDVPHYLGPQINATQGVATRIKFLNLLPAGRAVINMDANGVPILDAQGQIQVTQRNGDLFLPVDPSIPSAGFGPDGQYTFTQNRALMHVLGADAPWISIGTPHQWITPIGESDAARAGSLAATIPDTATLATYLRGVSTINVPDMPDPGPGATTYYIANQQTGRMLFIRDNTAGITRLNTYAGLVAPYALGDAVEQDLITRKVIPGSTDTQTLVLQDKCFVPDDIALQDGRWNTTAWGSPGDLWLPHVYETVQDPMQASGFNAVGRWAFGPWFWPIFPALYVLPTGAYGDVTFVPDSWCDTPVVNGVAYPHLDVEPKAYRLRLINGSNDRYFTFNLFVGDANGAMIDSVGNVGTPATFDAAGNTLTWTWKDAAGAAVANPVGATYPSEVKMITASQPANPCATETRADNTTNPGCTPVNWPTDGRAGGVPDPLLAGPTLYQIGNEAGLLPRVVPIDPLPANPLYDVGRATVLNLATSGLHLSNGVRADVVVDFSQYAGKTLIVYNDMFAPVWSTGEPRVDYATGGADHSSTGGAEPTRPGYGPNTRTLMQIRVGTAVSNPASALTVNAAALNALTTDIPRAYAGYIGTATAPTPGAGQPAPLVAQSAYNRAFNPLCANPDAPALGQANCWDDAKAYASIFNGTVKQPRFDFVPGAPNLFDGINVTNGGAGYITPPAVTFIGGGATVHATAKATLKIGQINVTNPGSGYVAPPTVTIAANGGGGGGAIAGASMLVNGISIINPGLGYQAAPMVTFSTPQEKGGVAATGFATVTAGKITAITITNPGSGYLAPPVINIAGPGGVGGVRASATATCGVGAITLRPADPNVPSTAGGGGYGDLSKVGVTLSPPTMPGGVTATAKPQGTVYDVSILTPGNYTTAPTVTLNGGGGAGATASVGAPGAGSILIVTKAEQELFDVTFGRANYIFGAENAFTNATIQTTIPLQYIDPPSETVQEGETQLIKLTFNGLSQQSIHFDGFDMQLINRVGWDNFTTAPDLNEFGWKGAVLINPLEDQFFAIRPKKVVLPGFGVPLSVRPSDPSQALGSPWGFTQMNPATGLPSPVVNQITNYGWEYTWDSQTLGHAEDDMRRPIIYNVVEPIPVAPSMPNAVAPTFVPGQPYPGLTLKWNDNATSEYQQIVSRATGAGSTVFTPIAVLPANQTTFIDKQIDGPVTYRYQVTAIGASGQTTSPILDFLTPALPPTAPLTVSASQISPNQVELSWIDNSATETSFNIESATVTNGVVGPFMPANPVAVTSLTTTTTGTLVTATMTETGAPTLVYRVAANNAPAGHPTPADYNSAWTSAAPIAVNGIPLAPSNLTVQATETSVSLGFTDTANNEGGFVVQMANVTARPATPAWTTVTTVTPQTGIGSVVNGVSAIVANGNSYLFRVCPLDAAGALAPNAANCLSSTTVPIMFRPAVPSNVTAALAMLGTVPQIKVSWTDNSTNELSFRAEYSTNGGVTWANVSAAVPNMISTTQAVTGTVYAATLPNAAVGKSYQFRVNSQNAATTAAIGTNPSATSMPMVVLPAITLAPTLPAPTASSQVLNWTIDNVLPTQTQIERRQFINGVAGPWTVLATTAAGVKTYTALGLVANGTYEFRLTPKYVAGLVARLGSPVMVSVVTQGLPVASVLAAPTAGAKGSKTCTLRWTSSNPVNAVSSWRVQSCTEPVGAAVPSCNNTTSVWTTVTNPVPAVTAAQPFTMSVTLPITAVLPSKTSYRVIGVAGTLQGAPSNVQMCSFQ